MKSKLLSFWPMAALLVGLTLQDGTRSWRLPAATLEARAALAAGIQTPDQAAVRQEGSKREKKKATAPPMVSHEPIQPKADEPASPPAPVPCNGVCQSLLGLR